MKPFAWSWSRLKNYRTCPKRHWHIDLAKDIREEESDEIKWGHEVHDAMAKAISGRKPLPESMKRYQGWVSRLHAMPDVELLVENKLAMDKDFRPCGFFDSGAWFRGVVDAAALNFKERRAIAIDWKTGQVKPDIEQLGLFAQLIFAKYPEIDRVGSIYAWLGYGTETIQSYDRDGMTPLWNGLWPEIRILEDAWKTTTYPAKPSGLCRNYCPVETCPHYGRGSL
jgi:hypothetical protein